MAKPDMTIKIETEVFENGDLASTVSSGYLGTFRKTVVSTIDQQVRDSLIKLGWTPPCESDDGYINFLEDNAKLEKDYKEGDLLAEYIDFSPDDGLLYAGQYNIFTLNELESLVKHMKKYRG